MKKINVAMSLAVIVFSFSDIAGAWSSIQKSMRADTFKVYYTTELFYDVDQRDAMVAIDLWTKEIGEQLNVGVVPTSSVFSSVDEVMVAYLEDDIDMAVFTTQEFLQVQLDPH